jgi:hypothetical protein
MGNLKKWMDKHHNLRVQKFTNWPCEAEPTRTLNNNNFGPSETPKLAKFRLKKETAGDFFIRYFPPGRTG